MLSKWFYNFKIRRTISALNMLDDHTLKDIGLNRSNIRSHAYEIFKNEKPEDPIGDLHNLYVKARY
tara:strand:- start:829 stop:1026 length:198 start_codon:yes stop_codon:yes gene_type:complete